MREKLIELIASKVCDTYSEACEEWIPHDCGKCYANNCHIAEIADHLLANGVTFATDNNVGSRWVPVTERLPKKEGWYQVFTSPDKGHKSINKARYSLEPEWSVNAGKGRWNGSGGTWTNVTHWMPLPEAPKEVE